MGVANVDHLERLSQLDFAKSVEILREVVRLDPRRSDAWIRLGLLAEQEGELNAAERAFEIASRIDHRYLPAWTRANYYFRRGNPDLFWEWAKRAVSLAYDDVAPIFSLADRFNQDPEYVLARLGDSTRLERAYFGYLLERKRLAAARTIALRLAALHDTRDFPRFASLTNWQLAAGDGEAALEAWNWFHDPPLDPVHGPLLFNSDLRFRPSGEGFDWALRPHSLCPGIEAIWRPGQVEFSLSGRQPDDCILMSQPLIVSSRLRYR